MTDATDQPPRIPVEARRRGVFERVSIVWLIPLAALLVALGIAWKSWAERGPVVQIAFDNAAGVKEGETELHYRDVAVGVVEKVGFSSELAKVLVTVRLDKDIGPYVDDKSIFWIVQPEVTTRGVTGLGTVLSGVYIEGVWDEVPGGLAPYQEGRSSAPLLRAGEEGIVISLRSTESVSLIEGTPVLYKGIEVGQVGRPELAAGGAAAIAEAVIRAPYAGLLRTTTRFWDTSGFSFKLGAQGAEIDFDSLASLISGGVAFETVASGGQSAQAGTTFALHPDEASARASFFSEGAGPALNLTVLFDENVSGLTAGSAVSFGGVVIGEVANVTGMVDPETFGDERVRLLATLAIRPSRLGIEGGDEAALDYLQERVAEGLRAQLQTASILTGGLRVELLEVPDAPPAELDLAARPFPRLPATESAISDVQATAEGVFERVNALPIEELIRSAIGFLDSATALVADGDLKRVPEEAVGLLADVRGIVGSEELQALPADVGGLIEDLRGATGDLRAVVAQLREADAAGQIVAAVASAKAASDALTAALEGAPDLVASLTQTSDAVQALPIEPLVARLSDLVAAAQGIVADADTQAIPADVRALLTETTGATRDLRALLTRLDEAQAVTRILATVDAAAAAAQGIETGTAGVPELVDRLTAVAAKAETLPLDELVAQVTALAGSADAILGADATQALPADLRLLLGDLRGVSANLTTLTGKLAEERAVERLLAAVDTATAAAGDVSASVTGLPDLIARLNAVAAKAETVPLDAIAADLDALIATANGFLGQDTTRALPASLNGALDEVQAALADLRAGGTVENANQTLAAARDAAVAIEDSAARLPDLVARIDTLLATANGTIAGYGENSTFARGTQAALRQVERAAEAVQSLARALERRPNSLILGR